MLQPEVAPKPVNRPRMLILLLHHVGEPPRGVRQRKLYITAPQLRAHLDWLKAKGYRFTTLTQALDSPDDRTACITFDDGFVDVISNALPVLNDVPATVFAVTSQVGQRGIQFDGIPADLASWDELKALKARGWEIGSHAHEHVRKPSQQNLEQSQHELEKHLGARATALAYPYGAHDAQTIEDAKAAGFRCAAITKSGLADRAKPFQLRRVILSGFGVVPGFERLKLMGVHHGVYPLNVRDP